MSDQIRELQDMLQEFATERDWDQFHNPKNLVMALVSEVGELAEIFQWLSPSDSQSAMSVESTATHVREELADVFGYVIRLADVLGVNLADALGSKIALNADRYPIDSARGNTTKYTEL